MGSSYNQTQPTAPDRLQIKTHNLHSTRSAPDQNTQPPHTHKTHKKPPCVGKPGGDWPQKIHCKPIKKPLQTQKKPPQTYCKPTINPPYTHRKPTTNSQKTAVRQKTKKWEMRALASWEEKDESIGELRRERVPLRERLEVEMRDQHLYSWHKVEGKNTPDRMKEREKKSI